MYTTIVTILTVHSTGLGHRTNTLTRSIKGFLLNKRGAGVSLDSSSFSTLLGTITSLRRQIYFRRTRVRTRVRGGSRFVTSVSRRLGAPLTTVHLCYRLRRGSPSRTCNRGRLLLVRGVRVLVGGLLHLRGLHSSTCRVGFRVRSVNRVTETRTIRFTSVCPSGAVAMAKSSYFELSSR